jgi:beta-glucosidase
VSPLAAMRRTVPEAKIVYSAGVDLSGTPIPASALSRGEGHGLEPPSISRGGDAGLDFQGASALAPDVDHSWSGTLTVPEEGTTRSWSRRR